MDHLRGPRAAPLEQAEFQGQRGFLRIGERIAIQVGRFVLAHRLGKTSV
jgi:hypothetical protein